MYSSGPELYNMCSLYWYSIMDCNCCDSVVTALLTIHQWFVVSYYVYFLGKAVVMEQHQCSTPRASHSMLLYCHCALYKVLLVNAVGHNAVLFGTLSHLQFMPSLTCKRPAPGPILEVFVSRHRGPMHFRISCMLPAWLCSWLCHVTLDTCHSMIILSSLIQASLEFTYLISHWWKLTQVIGYTQKWLQFIFTLRWWHGHQCLHFSWIQTHSWSQYYLL